MRKGRAAALLLLTAWVLSGCIPITDLQDRAIVQGVGIDWADGQYEVTMQVFSSEGSGGQTIVDPSKENARIITCRGKSVAEAVAGSAGYQGKEFYLGHNRILILGGSIWNRPLEESLSYFGNSPDSRLDMTMLATPGSAAEILDAGISQTILPAMSIENTVRNAEKGGLSAEILLADVLQALAQPHRSAVIPVLERAEPENSENRDLKGIALTGMAVFSGKGLEALLEGDEVRGMLFLRNQMKNAVYAVGSGESRAAVEFYRSSTRIIPEVSADDLRFRVRIDAEGMITERLSGVKTPLTEKMLAGLEQEAGERIAADCQKAWKKSGESSGADVLALGDLVWNDQPELWEVLRRDWKKHLPRIRFSYEVHAEVRRTGMMGEEKYKFQ